MIVDQAELDALVAKILPLIEARKESYLARGLSLWLLDQVEEALQNYSVAGAAKTGEKVSGILHYSWAFEGEDLDELLEKVNALLAPR